MLYNTLILPHISYCNIVWGNSSNINTNNILKLQKRALRLCTGSHYLANTDPLFHRLHTLKFTDVTILQTAIFMYKLSNNALSSSFNSIFTFNKDIHRYPTRISHNFHLSNPKLSLASKSIRHYGPDIWNPLPESIKLCPSLFSFKHSMKKYLLSKYSPSEI